MDETAGCLEETAGRFIVRGIAHREAQPHGGCRELVLHLGDHRVFMMRRSIGY